MGKEKTMSNSALVTYKRLSPNCTKPRNHKIDRIVIHHMAGNLTVQQCGAVFAPSSRQASSNYGVDSNGKVGMYVEEKNRSWATANAAIDHRAVTIEVANSKRGGNWPVSAKALKKTIELCADICKRNGIKKLNYTGDKTGNLHMHCWYAATSCPGPYLKSKFPYIAKEVNKLLEAETKKTSTAKKTSTKSFKVRVSIKDLNIRTGPGTNYKSKGFIKPGVYTIVKTDGKWGKLKSGAGWIHLDYAKKL